MVVVAVLLLLLLILLLLSKDLKQRWGLWEDVRYSPEGNILKISPRCEHHTWPGKDDLAKWTSESEFLSRRLASHHQARISQAGEILISQWWLHQKMIIHTRRWGSHQEVKILSGGEDLTRRWGSHQEVRISSEVEDLIRRWGSHQEVRILSGGEDLIRRWGSHQEVMNWWSHQEMRISPRGEDLCRRCGSHQEMRIAPGGEIKLRISW